MPELVLAAAVLLLPFAAAAALAINMVLGEPLAERGVRRIAGGAIAISLLIAAWIFASEVRHPSAHVVHLGRWLDSGDYHVDLELLIDPLSATMMVLTAGFGWLVARFSTNYMHRERGFCRFYAVLSLFIASMLLLVMGGNLVMTFAGWEGAGLCSYLLIGFYYDRKAPARAGTRALITNRIGDAGFLAAIFLTFTKLGAIDFPTITASAGALDPQTATAIALCLLLAAAAKSAQIPFSPWLARAMEGPTPSSALFYAAVMVNAGVYLVVRAHALFDAAPAALAVMATIGGATALYGGIAGAAQTDVKSSLIFSTTAQLGVMFLACGLGDPTLAIAHMAAHALFRCFQFLSAPSVLLRPRPGAAEVPPSHRAAWLAPLAVGVVAADLGLAPGGLPGSALQRFLAPATGLRSSAYHLSSLPLSALVGLLLLAGWSAAVLLWRAQPDRTGAHLLDAGQLHAAALHRFWLEEAHTRWIAHPVLWLGRRLDALDARLDPGAAPAAKSGPTRGAPALLERLVDRVSSLVQGIEEHVVARAIGRGIPVTGKLLGRALNYVDAALSEPLVAGAMILLCLVAVLRGVLQ